MSHGFEIKLRYVVSEYSVFVKNIKNSQENPCAGVSFLIKLQAGGSGKRICKEVFSVNFS